LLGRE
jgi:shikimate kinase